MSSNFNLSMEFFCLRDQRDARKISSNYQNFQELSSPNLAADFDRGTSARILMAPFSRRSSRYQHMVHPRPVLCVCG
ncbi:hypothetical protein GHT06_008064 [Daphnia sinensis]|uniref:Uncharacterized protein n=1 Tax=Daphnia sinensis TaxID=1820382 RepID=A0AAD5LKB8_9CRUS|nr:hypothetical protein GHT06_008064 [Daphnia sinensis]